MKRVFLLFALLMLSAQRDPILVPEVSQDDIQVQQGFTGTELLLFGAILAPTGARAGQAYDIVVVLVDERTAVIYELGLDHLQLSPSGTIDPEEQARFTAGLVDLRRRQGLYKEVTDGVQISEQVLYQARISLPSNVQTGTYTAETFAITRGRVIASAIAEVEVRKVGFERFVEVFAERLSLLYGLLAVLMSVGTGGIAGRLFAMI